LREQESPSPKSLQGWREHSVDSLFQTEKFEEKSILYSCHATLCGCFNSYLSCSDYPSPNHDRRYMYCSFTAKLHSSHTQSRELTYAPARPSLYHRHPCLSRSHPLSRGGGGCCCFGFGSLPLPDHHHSLVLWHIARRVSGVNAALASGSCWNRWDEFLHHIRVGKTSALGSWQNWCGFSGILVEVVSVVRWSERPWFVFDGETSACYTGSTAIWWHIEGVKNPVAAASARGAVWLE
jgi:hypothetical protein